MVVGTPIYCSKSIENPQEMLRKLNDGIFCGTFFCITLSQSDDVCDIYSTSVLLQPFMMKEKLTLIGMTATYDEAKDMVKDIAMEAFADGTDDLKAYLIDKIKTRDGSPCEF